MPHWKLGHQIALQLCNCNILQLVGHRLKRRWTHFLCSLYSTRRVQLESVFLFLIFAASVDYQMKSGTTVPCGHIEMIEKLDSSQLQMSNGSQCLDWAAARPGSTERRIQRWLSTTACQLWTAAGGLYIQLCHAGPMSPQIWSHNTLYVSTVSTDP